MIHDQDCQSLPPPLKRGDGKACRKAKVCFCEKPCLVACVKAWQQCLRPGLAPCGPLRGAYSVGVLVLQSKPTGDADLESSPWFAVPSLNGATLLGSIMRLDPDADFRVRVERATGGMALVVQASDKRLVCRLVHDGLGRICPSARLDHAGLGCSADTDYLEERKSDSRVGSGCSSGLVSKFLDSRKVAAGEFEASRTTPKTAATSCGADGGLEFWWPKTTSARHATSIAPACRSSQPV